MPTTEPPAVPSGDVFDGALDVAVILLHNAPFHRLHVLALFAGIDVSAIDRKRCSCERGKCGCHTSMELKFDVHQHAPPRNIANNFGCIDARHRAVDDRACGKYQFVADKYWLGNCRGGREPASRATVVLKPFTRVSLYLCALNYLAGLCVKILAGIRNNASDTTRAKINQTLHGILRARPNGRA